MTKPADQNLRAQSKAQTLQKLSDAARTLFLSAGYKDTTTRAIAKAAGMSTGAFTHVFKDKADCYRTLFGHDPLTPEQGLALAATLRRAEAILARALVFGLQDEIDALLPEIREVLPAAPTPAPEADPVAEAEVAPMRAGT